LQQELFYLSGKKNFAIISLYAHHSHYPGSGARKPIKALNGKYAEVPVKSRRLADIGGLTWGQA
jgi:hypothetical protein